VVTFDHELVDADTVRGLEDRGAGIRPGGKALSLAADKARQRVLLESLGIAVPPYSIAGCVDDAARAGARFG